MKILIFGEETLVKRHVDMLSQTSDKPLIQIGDNDIESISDYDCILVCNVKTNIFRDTNIWVISVEDTYPSALSYYYLTLEGKDLSKVSSKEFLSLLSSNIREKCKSKLYEKLQLSGKKFDIMFDLKTGYSSTILPLIEKLDNKKNIALFENEEVINNNYFKNLSIEKLLLPTELNFHNRACEIFDISKIYISPEYSSPTSNEVINFSFPHTLLHKPIKVETHIKLLQHSDYIFIPTRYELKKIEYILKKHKSNLYKEICLIPGGYPKLDKLRQDISDKNYEKPDSICYAPTILEHNSEFQNALNLTNGVEIIDFLLKKFPEYNIIFRPSPTVKRFKHTGYSQTKEIIEKFGSNPKFIYDESLYYIDTFKRSKILISDHSSTMMTFSYATLRPFISFNKESISSEYKKVFGSEELDIRGEVGEVVCDFSELEGTIRQCLDNNEYYENRIKEFMEKEVYNLDSSVDYFKKNIEYILNKKKNMNWIYI